MSALYRLVRRTLFRLDAVTERDDYQALTAIGEPYQAAIEALSASIQELYMARSRGEVSGFTVPAMNLRAQTFDMARVIYETAKKTDTAWPNRMGSEIFIMVALRCTENRIPCFFASSICSA